MGSNKMDKKTKQNRDAENPQWRLEIGGRISRARESLGMSQNELADHLGVNRVTLTYWENGTRDIKTTDIVRLADILGVSCDFLLRGIKTENVSINKQLGLSEKAIDFLVAVKRLTDHMEKITQEITGSPYNGQRIYLQTINLLIERLADTHFWDMLCIVHLLEFPEEEIHLDDKVYEKFPDAWEYIAHNGGVVMSAAEKSESMRHVFIKRISEYIETALLLDKVPEPENLPYYKAITQGENTEFNRFMKGGSHYADNNETE